MEWMGLSKKGTRESRRKCLSGNASKLASLCNYGAGSIVVVSQAYSLWCFLVLNEGGAAVDAPGSCLKWWYAPILVVFGGEWFSLKAPFASVPVSKASCKLEQVAVGVRLPPSLTLIQSHVWKRVKFSCCTDLRESSWVLTAVAVWQCTRWHFCFSVLDLLL